MKLSIGMILLSMGCCVSGQTIAANRPTSLVHHLAGKAFGIFDPTTRWYQAKKENISSYQQQKTLSFLKSLHANSTLKKAAMRSDPSLAALIDSSAVYSALATRYRYEPLMVGSIQEQEKSAPQGLFAAWVRSQSQNSAWSKAVRNRFRSIELLASQIIFEELQKPPGEIPYTIGNLGGAAGDDISAAVAQATFGRGTNKIRQIIFDIDKEAMRLGTELGKTYYHYPVETRPEVNLLDLGNLPAIEAFLRKENVKWINSIGFFMEYKISKLDGGYFSADDKAKLLAAYCRGGVEKMTLSAYGNHPLPRYVNQVGWKMFELGWTKERMVSLLDRAGYTLEKYDDKSLPLMQVYSFKGNCR